MADRLLIAISARQVSVASWHGGHLAKCETFAAGEAGLIEFTSYLARVGNQPVQLLVDAVEEDYRLESLPHSFGSERKEMVNRKLKQYYRNTPYCNAQLQGRDADKRHDDRYLFCALTNPDLIAPWVRVVNERGLPIAGIYLAPTVSVNLAAKLQLKQSKALIVSIDSVGMRLTLLRDQKLRASRLALIDFSGAHAIKNYVDELSNTRLYLHALHILTLDEQLSVLIVDANDALSGLVEAIARENPNLDCRRLGRQEIIAQVGISAAALDSSRDSLPLHLLGLRPPDNNLAPPYVTIGYRQHRVRRGIYALTGLAAITSAAWCAFTWYQVFDIKSETEAAMRQTAQLQSEYREATRQFPAAPTSADNLKRAVEISQKIGATLRSPETMMHVVSQALETNPLIALNSLGWKYDRTDIESVASRANSPAVGGAVPGASAVPRRQTGLVEGEVRPFRGDYRAAIETINRFVDVLSKRPEVADVRIVTLPLNISPTFALSGNTSDNRDQSAKAGFKLLLVLK